MLYIKIMFGGYICCVGGYGYKIIFDYLDWSFMC